MPIYEFTCNSCGHEFEKIVSFSATHAPACPSCEANAVTRRMGRPAIHFKGSGWYITDSKKGNGHSNGNGSNGIAKNESTTNSEGTAKSESAPKSESSSESSSEKAAVKADVKAAKADVKADV